MPKALLGRIRWAGSIAEVGRLTCPIDLSPPASCARDPLVEILRHAENDGMERLLIE